MQVKKNVNPKQGQEPLKATPRKNADEAVALLFNQLMPETQAEDSHIQLPRSDDTKNFDMIPVSQSHLLTVEISPELKKEMIPFRKEMKEDFAEMYKEVTETIKESHHEWPKYTTIKIQIGSAPDQQLNCIVEHKGKNND